MDTETGDERAIKQPASRRVADLLRSAMDSGELAVDDLLPSYRDLMAEHGIALNTAQAAVQILEQEGRVVRGDRRRAKVAEASSPRAPEAQLRELREDLGSLRDEVQKAGATFGHIERRLTAIVDRLSAPASG